MREQERGAGGKQQAVPSEVVYNTRSGTATVGGPLLSGLWTLWRLLGHCPWAGGKDHPSHPWQCLASHWASAGSNFYMPVFHSS